MSANATQPNHTEHALLVLLGQYAQHLGLIQALMAVPLHQKTVLHRPQAKILEFLVAILAGLPHLEDISRDGRPLDQDQTVATAWQQAGWADYSGVGRTLQALTQTEAEAIAQVLREISRPIIDEQVTQALATQGRLIYDGDLTGRPVSNTSTTYPEAAFGHMDDEVRLGYQAAVVSVGSPRMAGTGSPSSRIQAIWCPVCWPKNWSWPRKPARACGPGGGPSCSANAGRPRASR